MTFVDDRFTTQLNAVSDAINVPLLESVEGTSSDIWPPSGALQEILAESNDSGKYLAGVGGAGKSHWSTIVSGRAPDTGIEFDFACRAKTKPDWIGSTYKVLIDSAAVTKPSGCVEFEIAGNACKLRCAPNQGSRVVTDEARNIQIVPIESEATLPRTERWTYHFELV